MKHQDFVDVGTASSLSSFKAGLVRLAEEMDFFHISAVLVVEQGPHEPLFMSVGNTPVEAMGDYLSAEQSRRDPVLKKLKHLSVPFIYDQSFYVANGAGDVWESQAVHGFKTGVAVGLHLPQERHFLLGVDRAQPLPNDDDKLTQMMAKLQLLAVHAQDAAQRLMTTKPATDSEIKLTPRETEVLRMTMTGMTALAIADRLHLTERVVQFHLVNVRRKFNTKSKHQAVLRAIALNLL